MPKIRWFFLLALLVAVLVSASGLYKWVDEQGGVHYTDTPPANVKARELEPSRPPASQEVDSAQRRAEQMKEDAARMEMERRARTPPRTPLGPLPNNATSEYLVTTGTGVLIDSTGPRPRFSFSLSIQARDAIPAGTYLVAYFESPARSGSRITVAKEIAVDQRGVKQVGVFFMTPAFDVIRCGYYVVDVDVLRSKSDTKPIGSHRQLIQSRIDSDRATSPASLLNAARPGGLCP